jgi:hypothetical protein
LEEAPAVAGILIDIRIIEAGEGLVDDFVGVRLIKKKFNTPQYVEISANSLNNLVNPSIDNNGIVLNLLTVAIVTKLPASEVYMQHG